MGQRCVASGPEYVCSAGPGTNEDAGVDPDAADAPIDSPDAPAGFACYGTGMVKDICFPQPPTTALVVSNNVIVDTAMVGGANCTTIVAQNGGPSLCVIAKQSITIGLGATLSATGANPLVLIAAGSIDITGTLDVSSHRSGNVVGAGARSTCTSGNGNNANAPPAGGGGGAGGSFKGAGANGGQGRGQTAGGTPAAASNPGVLLGGCAGGRGGTGAGGGGAGNGGAGGGAVYVIAGSSIKIMGSIKASGAGGTEGTGGLDSGGGAGGGGSGGMIGLDAPVIQLLGTIAANGGGGGGGNGDDFDRPGQPGGETMLPGAPATGGNGGNGGGGNGGAGFAQPIAPAGGSNGSNPYCGGGGGGGGSGVIRVFGVAPGSVTGAVSPVPS